MQDVVLFVPLQRAGLYRMDEIDALVEETEGRMVARPRRAREASDVLPATAPEDLEHKFQREREGRARHVFLRALSERGTRSRIYVSVVQGVGRSVQGLRVYFADTGVSQGSPSIRANLVLRMSSATDAVDSVPVAADGFESEVNVNFAAGRLCHHADRDRSQRTKSNNSAAGIPCETNNNSVLSSTPCRRVPGSITTTFNFNMASCSGTQQAHDSETNMQSVPHPPPAQHGLLQALIPGAGSPASNPPSSSAPVSTILSLPIQAFATAANLAEKRMEALRLFFSAMELTPPPPARPDLRQITRVSRLLDATIHIDPVAPPFTVRLLTALGMRRWWQCAIIKYLYSHDPRVRNATHSQLSRQTGHPHATLFDLPNEVLAAIIDAPQLSDLDRLRFGSTCALIMANTIPILYKYALLRYPVRNLDMNLNYSYVGHFVRELIIHVPENVVPVFLEAEYISLYDILNKMTGLRSVTLYFDAPIGPTEVSSLLRYLLATKPRLQNITLDISTLVTSIYAYDSRTIYDLRRAIDAVTTPEAPYTHPAGAPPTATPPQGAQLHSLSLAVKDQAGVYAMRDILQVFAGHCDRLMYLRALPRIRPGEEMDFGTLRSPAMLQLTWAVTSPSMDLFTVGLRALAQPDTLREARVIAVMSSEEVLGCLGHAARNTFPFQNLQLLSINQLTERPVNSLKNNRDLRRSWEAVATSLLRKVAALDSIVIAEHGRLQQDWAGAYRVVATRIEGNEIGFFYGVDLSRGS
ncbi:LOW QUALITY PROTEIN: hypothetical protein Dda_1055 [Drechslerella dactyloides]|uniref:Uncharacterized protein n=1 Tax=Drechslerella dactyloides TaxID=74499 RepID=A0AAD6J6M8_DREDA|nr:LOW QUALITY PROTEIN: hypothetical protein Dda_1055 [Drechslerella dactyloides]